MFPCWWWADNLSFRENTENIQVRLPIVFVDWELSLSIVRWYYSFWLKRNIFRNWNSVWVFCFRWEIITCRYNTTTVLSFLKIIFNTFPLYLECFSDYFAQQFSIRRYSQQKNWNFNLRINAIVRDKGAVQWRMGESAGAILLTSLQLSEWVRACHCSSPSSAFAIFWSVARKPERERGLPLPSGAPAIVPVGHCTYLRPTLRRQPPSSVVKQVVMFCNNLTAGRRRKWVVG